MFPTFISILDIQSWWEVPSIAHFCSLFRSSFNLLDFDIEDLEEALLTDGTEENSWLQELIVRLLTGCLPNNEISTFNYQMFLRRLFREKCKEHDRYNPFNTDIDFQLLPLRTKVDILYALCDFRLDAEDVLEQLKNLEADSLRVEPLGYDDNDSAYWYFYGTRLYREDFKHKNKKGSKSVWQVICFTQDDWFQLAKKFKKSQSKNERQLYQTLTENFLPELPRLFHEKERLARKRLLENQPRRTSNRLGIKKKQELEAEKERKDRELTEERLKEEKELKEERLRESEEETKKKKDLVKRRREAYRRRVRLRGDLDEEPIDSEEGKDQSEEEADSHSFKSEGGNSSSSNSSTSTSRYEMARDKTRSKKSTARQRKNSGSSGSSRDHGTSLSRTTNCTAYRNNARNNDKQIAAETIDSMKSSIPSTTTNTTTVGRQTNNSLAAATGQIVIQPPSNPQRKKLKTSQVFGQTEEDLQVGMHKILDYVKNHEDAWPFIDPVEEEYAPNYYSIIRKPMDLQRMENRLDAGYYKTFSRFRADFQLIVDNCRLYNGVDNEYTEMVGNLAQAFEKATEKYLDQISSSDEEIRIEYMESESETKSNASKKDTSVVVKRKPMLAAQTDKKKERSPSVESIKKKNESFDNLSKIKTKKNVKEVSQPSKELPMKKKSAKPISKSGSKSSKKKAKKNLKNNKKITKKISPPNSVLSRSRSVSQNRSLSPSSHHWSSSPPPSWPPSSPESQFNFESKNNSRIYREYSEDELSNNGKDKENKHDRWDEIFQNETEVWRNKNYDKPSEKSFSLQKPKDKHTKLRETIEKLKAKSEISKKFKDNFLDDFNFDHDVKENRNASIETIEPKEKKCDDKKKTKKDKLAKLGKRSFDLEDGNSTADSLQSESKNKKICSKNSGSKNATLEALTLATEQTLKDINKWLDDTPRLSEFSSASNSPSHYLTSDDFENVGSRIEQDAQKKVEKPAPKKEGLIGKDVKRRPFNRDPTKFLKRREVQRTIDRLQPGKSKGNLLSNVQNTNKVDEIFPLGPISKVKDAKNSLIVKTAENAPKLSLGSVLDSFGKHKFVDDLKKEEETLEEKQEKLKSIPSKLKEESKDVKTEDNSINSKEDKTDPLLQQKQVSPGKATPNLSAWFKAFGAPKVQPPQKKTENKLENKDEKSDDSKLLSKDEQRKVSLPDPSPNSDVQSPALHGVPAPRQRKASTGSSISERSSFSQDMDSPRVGIDERLGAYPAPYPSPLHKSPSGASPLMPSPRPDVSPKSTTYPTLNGQIRVGFYQDTVSTKSSPENPQSPYYSEHIYTPSSMQGQPPNYSYSSSPYYPPNYSSSNPTPPYNPDHSNISSYYDTSKPLTDQYQAKTTIAYHQTINSPNYQPSSNSPNYTANSPNLQQNSPHYSPHSPSCNSANSPNLSSAANSPLNSPNYQPSSNSPINSPNYAPSSNSPANSPNYPPPNSPSFNAPNSPSFNAANSPNYTPLTSPHSPGYSKSTNSPGYQPVNSPSCQSANSLTYQSANSPNYQASNSPNYQTENSPNYQTANSPHYHSSNSPNYQMSNSPTCSPNYQTVNNSSGFQTNSKVSNYPTSASFQQINASEFKQVNNNSPTSPTFREPNSPLPQIGSPFPSVSREFDEFQQSKQTQNSVFPVKKRAYSDTDLSQHQESLDTQNQQQTVFSNRQFETNAMSEQQVGIEIPDQTTLSPSSNNLSIQNSSQPKTIPTSQFSQQDLIQTKTTMPSNQQSNSASKPESVSILENKRNVNFSGISNLYGHGGNYPLNIPSARPLDLNSRSGYPASESKSSPVQSTKSNDTSTHFVDPLNSYSIANNLQQTIMGQSRLGSEGLGNRLNGASNNFKASEVSNPYKSSEVSRATFNTPTTTLSAMEQSLNFQRNLATLSHIVDRFQSGERLLQGLQSTASYYADKSLGTQIYTNPMTTTSTSLQQMLNQSVNQYSGQNVQNSVFNRTVELQNSSNQQQQQVQPSQQQQQQQQQQQTAQIQEKKSRRKKSIKSVVPTVASVADATGNVNQGFQSYSGLKNTSSSVEPGAISLKTAGVVPGSAFNFGPATSSLGLSSGLYGDKDAYSNFLDEYRTAPNYYMAAAAAAAAAAHNRSTPENSEKQARTAHQQPSTAASTPSYPFIGAPQPRPPGYPFMTPHQASSLMDPSSPLYQQYLQAGVLHQGLLGPHGAYPAGYHPALGMRQPFDSMTRPPWL